MHVDPAGRTAGRFAAHLREELRTVPKAELWRHTADMIYLLENPEVREAHFPSGADQFRREWSWAGRTAEKIERVVLGDEWQNLPLLMVELSKHLEKVNLPKRNTLGTPWVGAFGKLAAERSA